VLSRRRLQEIGGIALAEALQWNPVLTTLLLSRNTLKMATAVAFAAALERCGGLAALRKRARPALAHCTGQKLYPGHPVAGLGQD
jgi:hypothetical protein